MADTRMEELTRKYNDARAALQKPWTETTTFESIEELARNARTMLAELDAIAAEHAETQPALQQQPKVPETPVKALPFATDDARKTLNMSLMDNAAARTVLREKIKTIKATLHHALPFSVQRAQDKLRQAVQSMERQINIDHVAHNTVQQIEATMDKCSTACETLLREHMVAVTAAVNKQSSNTLQNLLEKEYPSIAFCTIDQEVLQEVGKEDDIFDALMSSIEANTEVSARNLSPSPLLKVAALERALEDQLKNRRRVVFKLFCHAEDVNLDAIVEAQQQVTATLDNYIQSLASDEKECDRALIIQLYYDNQHLRTKKQVRSAMIEALIALLQQQLDVEAQNDVEGLQTLTDQLNELF
jgi:hypothetical protein